jgi:hypothetical protein
MDRTDRHQWEREPCEQRPQSTVEKDVQQDLEQDVFFEFLIKV